MKAGGMVAIFVLASGIGGAAWYAFREEPLPPERVLTSNVKRGEVVRKVRGVGHVEPVTQVKVSANISGDLLRLLVKDGSKVKRGELLADIDREQLAAIVRQNEANTKSQLAAVALESAQLEQAKAEEQRTLALHRERLATDAEVERLRANVAVIDARLEAAHQRVLQAQAALDEARARLEQTRIFAPIDGTVISLKKKEGEKIRGSDLAEDILLVLAPLQAMQVQVEVSEQDVVGVEVGQTAEITIDALGGSLTLGKVIEIANSAIIRNPGSESETTSFPVKVALDDIPEKLRSGMSAAVAIVTATHRDVLSVPIEAVTARLPSQLEERAEDARKKKASFSLFGGKEDKDSTERSLLVGAKRERPVEIVFVVREQKAEPLRVRTGISSETVIEIVDGVEEQMEIVTGPHKALSRTLTPGTPLEIVRNLDKTRPPEDAIAADR